MNLPMKVPLTQTIPAAALQRADTALAALRKRSDVGFLELPNRENLWKSSDRLGQKWREEFSLLVVIGIGGSSLGPQSIEDILGHGGVFVLDNLDPMRLKVLDQRISQVGLGKTGFAVISKSGTTLETVALASVYAERLSRAGLSLSKHFVAITEPKQNALRIWAEKNSCMTLEIPEDVGGRYSVLSPVGMFPAAFLGTNLGDWRQGAHEALHASESLVRTSALVMESFERQEWITISFFYSSVMRNLGGWWQQLWAESLAKKVDRKNHLGPRVSTPLVAIGACDQHSLLQQMMEGAKDKWILFYSVDTNETSGPKIGKSILPDLSYIEGHEIGKILNIEARATLTGLSQSGVSVQAVTLQDLSPRTLGFYFMYWQMVVAIVGEILSIDAYTQPGVELAKRLAKENLVRP